jgi:nitrogen fixation/metabolism regulation signal transduction histidine kinase
MRRPASFATRLFIALFLLSAVPAVALLGVATWALRDYVQLTGDAGAWGGVAETGQEMLSAVERAGADSALAAAARTHEAELSRSVRLARRFDLIASRLADELPWVALGVGFILALGALGAARYLARSLSRPVEELVDWSERLAREEPLPPPAEQERGPAEFAALRRAFREMADRLAEGRRQALEAERLRTWTDMARRVAHELKNPLTPLGLAVRQARGAAEAGDLRGLTHPLEVIREESARLDEMARSFAQLGRLPDEPVIELDLVELLEGLLATDVPAAVHGALRVEDGTPLVEGRLEALNRVFRNLLANAVTAVEGRSDPRVEVSVRRRDGRVEVAIADNGPGVPAPDRERIWDPDFTTRTRGTGLGLALVRQTVAAHGGEVELAESEEGGACFVVRLPTAGTGTA